MLFRSRYKHKIMLPKYWLIVPSCFTDRHKINTPPRNVTLHNGAWLLRSLLFYCGKLTRKSLYAMHQSCAPHQECYKPEHKLYN